MLPLSQKLKEHPGILRAAGHRIRVDTDTWRLKASSSHPCWIGSLCGQVINRVLVKVQFTVGPPHLVKSSLACLDVLQNIPLIHYIDDIMLISQDEQE